MLPGFVCENSPSNLYGCKSLVRSIFLRSLIMTSNALYSAKLRRPFRKVPSRR